MTEITLLLFLFVSFAASTQKSSLKKSANHFHETVANVTGNKLAYINNLKPLLDPSANVDSLCNDYYDHWKNSRTKTSFPSKVKIKKVNKLTKNKAQIIIHCNWYDINYGVILYVSQSVWLKQKGLWYRSGIPEESISAKRLK